jgi:hypothetical protein
VLRKLIVLAALITLGVVLWFLNPTGRLVLVYSFFALPAVYSRSSPDHLLDRVFNIMNKSQWRTEGPWVGLGISTIVTLPRPDHY